MISAVDARREPGLPMDVLRELLAKRPGLDHELSIQAWHSAEYLMRRGLIKRREVTNVMNRMVEGVRPQIARAFLADPREGLRQIALAGHRDWLDAAGEVSAQGLCEAIHARLITRQEALDLAAGRPDEHIVVDWAAFDEELTSREAESNSPPKLSFLRRVLMRWGP